MSAVTIDPWDPMPMYRQLASILRGKIERGEYRAGEKFPSELELRREYGVGRDTARAAIALLRRDGSVVSFQGRGTFVPPDGWDAT